jgi:hypothetical protein
MNYALRILNTLDERLEQVVDLTLYGRAALQLGFDNPPEDFSQSLDVDAVLALGQAEELLASTNFWDALEDTNTALAPSGLYMTHLFVEDQVILTPEWQRNRETIAGSWRHLSLHRLGDADLLLSKLMRDDPQDRHDALFIVGRNRWTRTGITDIISRARVPAIAELEEQFSLASSKLLDAIETP